MWLWLPLLLLLLLLFKQQYICNGRRTLVFYVNYNKFCVNLMQIFILLQWQWFNIIEWLLNFIIIVSPRVRSFALLWSVYAYIRYCLLGNWGESVRHMHMSCLSMQWVHVGHAEEKWLMSWELQVTDYRLVETSTS